MISEKQLSVVFDSFWHQHFPLLDSTYVRRFNTARDRIIGTDGHLIPPVPMGTDIDRYDLVAEIAFEMAREKHSSSEPWDPELSITRAVKKMAAITHAEDFLAPSTAELAEAEALFAVYEEFLGQITSSEKLIFRPRIQGAGILNAMEADFCSNHTLYEVKAVNRNLHSSDIRQVICYLIAALGSREYAWTNFCIFNPRQAVVYRGEVTALLEYVSGRQIQDCIAVVLNSLMDREEPLETRF